MCPLGCNYFFIHLPSVSIKLAINVNLVYNTKGIMHMTTEFHDWCIFYCFIDRKMHAWENTQTCPWISYNHGTETHRIKNQRNHGNWCMYPDILKVEFKISNQWTLRSGPKYYQRISAIIFTCVLPNSTQVPIFSAIVDVEWIWGLYMFLYRIQIVVFKIRLSISISRITDHCSRSGYPWLNCALPSFMERYT